MKNTCFISNCDRTVKAKGLCYNHYHAQRLNISYEEQMDRERKRKKKDYHEAESKDPERLEMRRERARRFSKKKRSTPEGRLLDNLMRDLRSVCSKTNGKLSKTNLMNSLYNAEELRKHIESQFTENMSWDNYGTYWSLDHIKPRKAFLTEYSEGKYESLEICLREMNALNNLRPMKCLDNIMKSSYYEGRKY